MADILTSYAKVLGDLYVTGCILLFHNFEEAGIFSENRCWSYVIAPLFTSIPYIIRFRQCLSEYMKSNFHKKWHLFNTLKYASAFPVIVLSALQKRYDFATLDSDSATLGQSTLYNLWLFSVALNSVYAFYWDVEKDWGLQFFTSGSSHKSRLGRISLIIPNFKLRRTMHFKWPIIYYLAILIDFLLRFTWSLKLSSHLHVVTELEARVFLMECLEIGRRWLWMFFKMEKLWVHEQKTLGYELMSNVNTRKSITTKETPSISSPNSTVFAAFLEQDFDPKAWLNTRLKSTSSNTSSASKRRRSSTTTNIHSSSSTDLIHGEKLNRAQLSLLSGHTAELVEKLQYLNQEVSNRLERTIENVVKSMPNVISELEGLKEDTEKLKVNLSTVQQHLGDVEGNTGIALDRLRYLDLVKTRMEASRAVLREAENWSSLEAEASTIFASQDYQKASVRLQEAEKSLAIFQNTPEYEERRRLLTELQNQLEATVSPQVVAALNQHDIKVCQKFYVIFDQIGRKKAFCNYYYGSRKAPLVQLWQGSLVLEDRASLEGTANSNSNNDDDDNTKDFQKNTKFVDFLKKFYDECFVVLNEEYTWCGSVFPDANETLAALIENIFNSIKPPVTARLAELVDYYHDQCLPQIIEAFTVSENFGRKIEQMLQRSIQTPKLSHTVEVKWGQSVFEPFLIYQYDYAAYEKNYLIAMLKKILSSNIKTSTVDLSRVILDTSGKLFNLVDEGLSRCMEFTHGFGSVGLIETLNQFFETTIKEYFILLNKLRSECGLDLKESKQPNNNNSELFAKSSSGPAASNLSLDDDFDQDNLAHEDWSNFQIGLRLLATCRTFSEKLDSFEHKTAETLLKTNELIQSADINNEKTNTKLHWYEQRRPSFQEIPTSVGTSALISLLQESPLNSYQLRELISSLEENHATVKEDEEEKIEINNQKIRKEHLLFRSAIELLDQFIRGCQRFVFDTIFLPIVKHLSNISKMEVWKTAPESIKQRSVLNLEIPTFSLSPSEYITRIGEHLLTLPQQFEVYADDKSLAFSISSLPHNDDTDDFGDDDKIETMTITQKSAEPKLPSVSNLELDTITNIDQQENVKETITVTHAWITSIARGTMYALVEKILSIPQLSKHGTRQLLTDLGYLTNVLSALDISAVDELLQIYNMLEMEEGQ
ncbi:871_t:CDS:2, partial [Ambispora gerdemannii]